MKTLVLAEKEDAAEQIARHLSCNPAEGYWFNDLYIVVAARGHLLDMWLKGLAVHSLEELPATELYYRVLKRDKPKISLIQSLSKQCKDLQVIVATDFDREGEVIGYNIVRHIWKITEPSQIARVYFHALTETELQHAFENRGTMDEALLSKGLARDLADTIVGLNLTKAMTLIFKEKYPQLTQAISIGRVQSPLLSVIKRSVGVSYEQEAETAIDEAESVTVYLVTDEEGEEMNIEVDLPPESRNVELLNYEEEEVDTDQATPFPDTSTIQSELPFSPDVSMSICESLYLKGYATYPRTRSHYLPKEVIDGLETKMTEHEFMPESFSAEYAQVPEEESKLPHWAITLTEEGIDALARGKIRGREKVVADYLITKIARAMAPPLTTKVLYANLDVDGKRMRINWSEECENPEDCVSEYHSLVGFSGKPKIQTGVIYETKVIRTKNHDVTISGVAFKPLFNVFSNKALVAWMEEKGLGTEATRHMFPVVLRTRNYVDKENLPNQLGETVATVIDELGLSPELTAEMENKIETIERLSDLDNFKTWIVETTKSLLDKLKNGAEIEFKCPKDHEAILINTRHGLFLRCEICQKFYSL